MTETCGAENRNGEPCSLSAGWGTDHNGEGRCKFHGGASSGGARKGAGAPENNGNAETHTLRSDPGAYYERQSEDGQDRIDAWAESWARRGGYNGLGFDKIFHTHATKLHQIESADEAIANEGVIITRIVDRTEAGEPIKKDEENPAFLLQSRALKDILRFLKEFGCLDDPDSQQADALQGGLDLKLSSEDKDALEAAFETE
jgi:hypothetical protein